MKAYPADRDDSAFVEAVRTIKEAVLADQPIRVSDYRVLRRIDAEEKAFFDFQDIETAAEAIAEQHAEGWLEVMRTAA